DVSPARNRLLSFEQLSSQGLDDRSLLTCFRAVLKPGGSSLSSQRIARASALIEMKDSRRRRRRRYASTIISSTDGLPPCRRRASLPRTDLKCAATRRRLILRAFPCTLAMSRRLTIV